MPCGEQIAVFSGSLFPKKENRHSNTPWLLTRGVTEALPPKSLCIFTGGHVYATRHVDWLSLTVDDRLAANAILVRPDLRFVGSGHHGYMAAFEDAKSGARIETDSPDPRMGTHITMSAQTLNTVRSYYPTGDDGLLAMAREVGARCSRIDLAINIHGGQLTVRDFYSAYKSGDLKTMTRRAYYVEGIGDDRAGDTLYFGSPKSDRQCRIYNKAAEQAIVDGEAWIRLELALRNLRAKNAVNAMDGNRCAAVIAAHMVDLLGWDNREFTASLLDDPVSLHPIKRKRPATEKWLLEQCAPALARVVAVNQSFMVEFMDHFKQSLDKLMSGD